MCVINEAGKILFCRRIDCIRQKLLEFTQELTPDDAVTLEVTTNAWAVADLLEPYVGRVVVSNPMKTKAIAEAKVKTDKVDGLKQRLLIINSLYNMEWANKASKLLSGILSGRSPVLSVDCCFLNKFNSNSLM